MFCQNCGNEISSDANFCPKCGFKTGVQGSFEDGSFSSTTVKNKTSPKSRTAALLMGIFLGEIGVHNFYLGKIGRGVAQVLLCVAGLMFFFCGSILTCVEMDDFIDDFLEFDNNVSPSMDGVIFYLLSMAIGFALSLWVLIEWILIAAGCAKDKDKLPVKNW